LGSKGSPAAELRAANAACGAALRRCAARNFGCLAVLISGERLTQGTHTGPGRVRYAVPATQPSVAHRGALRRRADDRGCAARSMPERLASLPTLPVRVREIRSRVCARQCCACRLDLANVHRPTLGFGHHPLVFCPAASPSLMPDFSLPLIHDLQFLRTGSLGLVPPAATATEPQHYPNIWAFGRSTIWRLLLAFHQSHSCRKGQPLMTASVPLCVLRNLVVLWHPRLPVCHQAQPRHLRLCQFQPAHGAKGGGVM
jgi:hypothetical protein